MDYGVKETELGPIPEDWELKRIGDFIDFKNGLNKEKQFFGFGTPIINYMDVFKNRGIRSNEILGKVSLTSAEIASYAVRQGDLFFTRTSETVEEIGIASVLLDKVDNTVFSGFVLRGREKYSVLEDSYKKYCFLDPAVRKQIISTASYTTRALTNGKLLSAVLIKIPSRKEQKAIAEALSDMDALIAQTEKLLEKKKAIKQGVMQELLKPKEGWVTKKLGDVCLIQKGQLITESTRIEGSVPVIAGGKSFAYLHNKANRNGKTITISASGASAGYVAFHDYPIFASDCSTISESSKYDIHFLFFWLELNQSKIFKMQTGGAQPHIHSSDLNPMEIPLPTITEQRQISTPLMLLNQNILLLEKQLQKLKLQKQGMMQALLTGKIRLV